METQNLPENQPNKPENNPLKLNLDHQNIPRATIFFQTNKGIIIAVLIVIFALVIGFKTLFNSASNEQYQGLIKKIDTETQMMKLKQLDSK